MITYLEYEIIKANWIAKNPNATYEQYQIAITKIARKLGL